jgi:uncharacterized phage protein (TIGR01671 family)
MEKDKIIFRGKPVNSEYGEWQHGFYLQDLDNGVVKDYIFSCPMRFEVIPKTIGQFTGIYDTKGVGIYEGDILRVCTFGFDPEVFVTDVLWDKISFRLRNGRNMFYFGQSDFTKMDDAAIIGNIYDNPELFKTK